MIGLPLAVGALQSTPSDLSPGVSDGAAAAAGEVGMVAVAAGDQLPSPRELPARTCTSYWAPFGKPVSVRDVAVVARSTLSRNTRYPSDTLALDSSQK